MCIFFLDAVILQMMLVRYGVPEDFRPLRTWRGKGDGRKGDMDLTSDLSFSVKHTFDAVEERRRANQCCMSFYSLLFPSLRWIVK